MPSDEQHTNRLAKESSPYLLQHAHNPVDWYPWGEEALGAAQRDAKPILLSVGYSVSITKVYPPPCHQGNSPTLGVIIISSLSGFVGFAWEKFSQAVSSWEV